MYIYSWHTSKSYKKSKIIKQFKSILPYNHCYLYIQKKLSQDKKSLKCMCRKNCIINFSNFQVNISMSNFILVGGMKTTIYIYIYINKCNAY